MGKARKGKRNTNDDDIDSDLEIGDTTVINDGKSKEKAKGKLKDDSSVKIMDDNKKTRKNKGKNRGDDDSELDEIVKSIEEFDISKKKSKLKKKKDSDNESETDESRKKSTKTKSKSKKLSISEDSDVDDTKKKKSKKSKKYSISEEDESDNDGKRKNKMKKSKKLSISEHDSDDESKIKTKKGKNKTKYTDENDSDVVKNIEDSDSKKKSKSNKTKKLSMSEDDDESIYGKSMKKTKGKPAKNDFDILDDIENDDGKKKKAMQKDEEIFETKKESGGKKSKKKRRKDDSDDEDLEKVLAELEAEYSGVKKEPSPDEQQEPKEVEKKKEKKVKKDKATIKVEKDPIADALIMDDDLNDFDDENIGGTVKTAAQKKREKKERERAKKMAEKQQKTTKKQDSVEKEIKDNDKDRDDESIGESITETKEKKKKKDDEKDKKSKTGRGPDKKTIAAMQEALRKMREEEERLKREEEERLRQEEEAEKRRLEQLRIEQERKEKKKQKEKERKERRKAEGKLLTPKQKLERARAQEMVAMLEEQRKQLLKAQGIEVDEQAEIKKPRPGTRIKPNKLKKESSQEKSIEEQKPIEFDKTVEEKPPAPKEEEKAKKKDEVKDAWDADSSDDDETKPSSQINKDHTVEVTKEPTPEIRADEEDDDEDDEEDETESESDEDEEDEESSSEEESEDSEDEKEKRSDAARKRERALARIQKRREEAEKNRSLNDLRAAVVCVLGHVDTGKTKILDKLRRTNVQDGEAGGITQQIGATNVPIDNIKEQTKIVKGFADKEFKLPGLLIIDTPGHESFSNLRSRGSSLCDIAILVVDIMHGLEPQTIESINLLKQRKTPFVVALNKIDRLYDWQTMNRKDVHDIIKAQASHTQLEFENRTKEVIVQFAEQGLNAALFYSNPDPKTYISLVPTSAITGEGMGNLLALIVDMCQMHLAKRLMYSSELQATVLEVKAIPGLGTTIDVILVNGILREGDTIVLAGTDGPIVTQIRSLLMPQPMRELRVKNAYIEYKEVRAAQGVKIAAKELEKAIAGLNLLVAHYPDEVDIIKEEVARELKTALSSIKLHERGVFVQASTLGSLEALLEFLRASKIPYAGIRIGPVVKKDVMRASIMLEHDSQYATILAFDVKIERDAQELADSLGVKIFQADIIYHLFDKFTAYREELKQRKREEFKHIAVFPCKLRVLPQFVFNSRDPIVCGVMVEAGIVKEGTPICVPSKDFIDLGIVTSIESNHKPVESARKGQEVCIKIEPIPGESPKMFGRHFDETDMLVSKISRQSIDACKDYFRDDLIKTDWQLMVELKKLFQIL